MAPARTTFLAIAIATASCAELPPQVHPTSPEAFVGKWEGQWFDSSQTVGHLDVVIKPPQKDMLRVLVDATNAIAPGFGAEAKFVNGELVLDQPNIRIILVFRLHGTDRLEADYHYRDRPNTGTWSLARKEK